MGSMAWEHSAQVIKTHCVLLPDSINGRLTESTVAIFPGPSLYLPNASVLRYKMPVTIEISRRTSDLDPFFHSITSCFSLPLCEFSTSDLIHGVHIFHIT